MGAITMRFGTVIPRMVMGSNNDAMSDILGSLIVQWGHSIRNRSVTSGFSQRMKPLVEGRPMTAEAAYRSLSAGPTAGSISPAPTH